MVPVPSGAKWLPIISAGGAAEGFGRADELDEGSDNVGIGSDNVGIETALTELLEAGTPVCKTGTSAGASRKCGGASGAAISDGATLGRGGVTLKRRL